MEEPSVVKRLPADLIEPSDVAGGSSNGVCSLASVGFLTGPWAAQVQGKIAMHSMFGRVIDEVAKSFSKCYVSLPVYPDNGTRDCLLQSDNVELISQPAWKNTFQGMKHPIRILRAGKRLVDCSDVIFVRGTIPYLPLVQSYAILRGKAVIQWMANNLRVVLKLAPEAATFKGRVRSTLAWFDEKWFRFIRKSSKVYMIASGCELYEKYKSARTVLVVSSTIRQDEFSYREDTCLKDPVRILFVSFVRPGKGLRYLVDALGRLKTSRQVRLAIVGDTEENSAEKRRVKKQIDELGLTDKVDWEGYARFGPELFGQLRRSDIFVLPTLTEGAPHVLVEARAFGLPVISTRVGGIPSSVKDGEDGILVPPKDSQALAMVIDKVVEDGCFRRKLIANGYIAAKAFSLEKFTEQVIEVISRALISHDLVKR